MLNSPEILIASLKKKFLIKRRLFAIIYWLLSLGLLTSALVLSLLSALISGNLLKSPKNYALLVLGVGAISSLISSALSFFLLRKRYLKNQLLLEFINLETILYRNREGLYGKTRNPELFFLNRIYTKLGVVPLLKERI